VLVLYRHTWGEDRVFFHLTDDRLHSVSSALALARADGSRFRHAQYPLVETPSTRQSMATA